MDFSRWLLGKLAENLSFSKNILFTDGGIVNFHNQDMWCEENPHAVRAIRFQYEFFINVHGGIVGDMLIGLFMLPNGLRGHFYLHFL